MVELLPSGISRMSYFDGNGEVTVNPVEILAVVSYVIVSDRSIEHQIAPAGNGVISFVPPRFASSPPPPIACANAKSNQALDFEGRRVKRKRMIAHLSQESVG